MTGKYQAAMLFKTLIAAFALLQISSFAHVHGGGVDSNGCHMQKSMGKEHCHGEKKSTKDARDIELTDSKECHRKFCRGIPDVPNSAPPYDAYGIPCRNRKN
jgi:hypothetical protein